MLGWGGDEDEWDVSERGGIAVESSGTEFSASSGAHQEKGTRRHQVTGTLCIPPPGAVAGNPELADVRGETDVGKAAEHGWEHNAQLGSSQTLADADVGTVPEPRASHPGRRSPTMRSRPRV